MCNCNAKVPVYFSKVKYDAIIPSKRDEDGCYDVYACIPEEIVEVVIKPGEIALIPTGIASAIPSGYRFGLRERGSTGTRGMSFRAGQIDSGYRGEWFVPINNTGNKTIVISKGYDAPLEALRGKEYVIYYPDNKAIVSVALEKVPDAEIFEIPYDDLKAMTSERMLGALGSSEK